MSAAAGVPLVVLGTSADGVAALPPLVATLRPGFPAPLLVMQHAAPVRPRPLGALLVRHALLPVAPLRTRTPLQAGTIYVAPPHRPVQISAPARVRLVATGGAPPLDLLLTSAATVYGDHLIAVLLPGLGPASAAGARAVLAAGGTLVLPHPAPGVAAEPSAHPPPAAIIIDLAHIGPLLHALLAATEVLGLRRALAQAQAALGVQTTTLTAVPHRLLQGVLQAQEQERQRVARELHDEIGQALTALVLVLGVIQDALPDPAPRERQILEDATGLAENMMSGLRRVIGDLRPPVLDDLGLVPALRRLGTDLHERTGVAVVVQADDLAGRLPPALELTLFRVAQEALTNVGKHTQAHRARIILRRAPAQVTLRIEDDGQGLPSAFPAPAEAAARGHFGLLGMQERVALLHGSLRLEAAPHGGRRSAWRCRWTPRREEGRAWR